MSPINQILQDHLYEPTWDVPAQYKIRNEILALEIPGLVDVQFEFEGSTKVRVTPVFANEKDYMWYNLKYGNPL
jgi:hypothetical protein